MIMRLTTVVGWSELLEHAGSLGFHWNYAHEILRAFQRYDGIRNIYCDRLEKVYPLKDHYISSHFLEQYSKDGDLNQMGRDIVADFMQKYNLKEMVVYIDK
jgi:hypothetical protein